jgi:hypothetical protein
MDAGMLLEGSHPGLLDALGEHSRTSQVFNGPTSNDESDLQHLREQAIRTRYSPTDLRLTAIDIPHPLRRFPSAPLDIPPETRPALDPAAIEKLMRSWHDGNCRLYPSAGALYPIKLIIEQVNQQNSTLIEYDVPNDRIVSVDVESRPGVVLDDALRKSSNRFWFIANLSPITLKYGRRGYRYALLEAGHAAQVMIQLLNWLGIQTRPFGGFDDESAARHLRLRSDEVVVHLLAAYMLTTPAPGGNWIISSATRYSVLSGHAVHYSTIFGGDDSKGRSIYGYGLDPDAKVAELKATAELAERIVLAKCRGLFENSNGMAAHSYWDFAAENAIMELYERHCLLKLWLLRKSTIRLEWPNSPAADLVRRMAELGSVEVVLRDIRDEDFDVPAVAAIAWHREHGGIIIGSSAARSEFHAANKCLLELAKSLYYRIAIRNSPVFERAPPDVLKEPEDHELFWANCAVAKSATQFLTSEGPSRLVDPRMRPSAQLTEHVQVSDLTVNSPDPMRWYICRAISDRLLTLEFGQPRPSYLERAKYLLKSDSLNCEPHPVG